MLVSQPFDRALLLIGALLVAILIGMMLAFFLLAIGMWRLKLQALYAAGLLHLVAIVGQLLDAITSLSSGAAFDVGRPVGWLAHGLILVCIATLQIRALFHR